MGYIAGTRRAKSGIPGSGDTPGSNKFPVDSQKSALSALKLRGHSNDVSPETVINKVARWAAANDNDRVKAAVAKARENS
jgi:hypothetical protein